MQIESIVKVMNFHSLLRVNKSKITAEKFFEYEKEITNFVDTIVNNRNFILDKKILKNEQNKKELNIYIANDLGFCGNFNSVINKEIRKDKDADKIIIGKKIIKGQKNVLLAMTKEQYPEQIKNIEDLLYKAEKKSKYSKINLVYNHYYNISKIELVRKTILPLEIKNDQKEYKEDFIVEGDINNILLNIIVLYLSYEIKIATENSYASENIMRQMLTKESLKKIDEIKEKREIEKIKLKKNKNFKKTLETYTNKKIIENK